MRYSFPSAAVALTLFLGTMVSTGFGQQPASFAKVVRVDRVIAGGKDDFLEVRHLVLAGSNEAIGRALAEIARERHRVGPAASQNPLRVRVQRRYIEKNYP